MARPKTMIFDSEYHKIKTRQHRVRNPDSQKTYYLIELNGVKYALSGDYIRQKKVKKTNIDIQNYVVCN